MRRARIGKNPAKSMGRGGTTQHPMRYVSSLKPRNAGDAYQDQQYYRISQTAEY